MFNLFKKDFDLEGFIAGSVVALQMSTGAHQGTWRLGEEESWNLDQEAGNIVFSFANGIVASASVQIIGTYNPTDGTFTWGWDHPSVLAALQQNAFRVKSFGEEHGSEELTTQKITCTEKRAWEFAALAMRLCKANGAYRVKAAPDSCVFMNFGEVSLAKTR